MPDPQHNERLNALLIRVHRSLLQYAVECWPWTDVDAAAEQATIEGLAREQESYVARMTELLVEREWSVDFGSFPDWSELHYVALDYLLGKLIVDEELAQQVVECHVV